MNQKTRKDDLTAEAKLKTVFSLLLCLVCILFAFCVRSCENNKSIEAGAFSGSRQEKSVTISDLAKKTEKLLKENASLSWLLPKNEK